MADPWELVALAASGLALAGSLSPLLASRLIRPPSPGTSSDAPGATSPSPGSAWPTYPTGTFLPTDADQAALERALLAAEDGLLTGGGESLAANPLSLKPSVWSAGGASRGSSSSPRPSTGRRS